MNILSVSQEQAALNLIDQMMGAPVAPKLKYVAVVSVNDASVSSESRATVTLTAKATTSDGQAGTWSGSKVLTVRRTRLRQGNVDVKLRIPFKDAMAIEHVLRGLAQFHGVVISAKELLFKLPGATDYIRLPESTRIQPGVIACKFHEDNIRYDPIGSEFSVELYRDVRPNVGVVVARADTGNINIVSGS